MQDQHNHREPASVSPLRRLRALAEGGEEFHLSYELMRDHITGHLEPLDAELVASHVTDCVMCRAELADLAAFDAALHTVPRHPAAATAAQSGGFLRRLQDSMVRHQWIWGTSAAALVLVIAAGPALFRGTRSSPGAGWGREEGGSQKSPGTLAHTEGARPPGLVPGMERVSSQSVVPEGSGTVPPGLPAGSFLADGNLRLGLNAQGMITGLPAETPFLLRDHLRRTLTDGRLPSPEALRASSRVIGGDPLPLYDLAAVQTSLPGCRLAAALVHWREGDVSATRRELEALSRENTDSTVVRQLLDQVR